MEDIVKALIPSDELRARTAPPTLLASVQFPTVLFYPCYPQLTRSLCGFHALFNATAFLDCYFSPNSDFSALTSPWQFWELHYHLLSFLKAHANLPPKDIQELEKLGPLERDQMEFLLSHYPILQGSTHPVTFLLIYFGFDIIQMGSEELETDERLITEFFSTAEPRAIVFLLGITNHWSVFMFVRGEDGQVREVYLDSMNTSETLSCTEDNLDLAITKENAERAIRGLKALNDHQRKVRKQHIRDVQRIIHILRSVALEHSSFRVFQLAQEVMFLKATFEEYVSSKFGTNWTLLNVQKDATTKEAVQGYIREWLLEGLRPECMLHEIVEVAERVSLLPAAKDFLRDWREAIHDYVDEELKRGCKDENEEKVVKLFLAVFVMFGKL